MEVTYNLEPKDLVQFNKFWWRRKSPLQSWLLMVGLLSLVLVPCASAVVVMTRSSATSGWPLKLWLSLMLIFFLLFFPSLYCFLVGRTARARTGFVGLHAMAINPAGLIQKSTVAETKVQWASVTDITEDEALIYIFLNQRSAFMIPKRGFASPQAAQEYFDAAKHFWKNPGEPLQTNEGSSAWPPPPQTLKP